MWQNTWEARNEVGTRSARIERKCRGRVHIEKVILDNASYLNKNINFHVNCCDFVARSLFTRHHCWYMLLIYIWYGSKSMSWQQHENEMWGKTKGDSCNNVAVSLSPSTSTDARNYLYNLCSCTSHDEISSSFFLSCLPSLKQIFCFIQTSTLYWLSECLSFLFTCNSFVPCLPLMFISLFVQYSTPFDVRHSFVIAFLLPCVVMWIIFSQEFPREISTWLNMVLVKN